MAQEERYGTRDLTYSIWHRSPSIVRFFEPHAAAMEMALALGMIDMDCVEYDAGRREQEIVAYAETAQDVGQDRKPATITAKVAALNSGMIAVPAYTVLYKNSSTPNPAYPQYPDIESFRVKRIWPAPATDWRFLA
jgi:hypothetical protein